MEENLIAEKIDENELDCTLILDDKKRCIALDCIPFDNQEFHILKRKELPLEYNKFCQLMDKYLYIDGNFILEEELFNFGVNYVKVYGLKQMYSVLNEKK